MPDTTLQELSFRAARLLIGWVTEDEAVALLGRGPAQAQRDSLEEIKRRVTAARLAVQARPAFTDQRVVVDDQPDYLADIARRPEPTLFTVRQIVGRAGVIAAT